MSLFALVKFRKEKTPPAWQAGSDSLHADARTSDSARIEQHPFHDVVF